jgi:carbonic anhydrase
LFVRDEVLAANARYAAAFDKGGLGRPPGRRFAVVTCMDARIDPATLLGLEEGDAHVIRNSGGVVTDDVIRSLVVSHWLLGTREVLVIGHTDCGMQRESDDELVTMLKERGCDPGDLALGTFPDPESSVRDGVERLRSSPLLPESFEASGFVYDVRSGRLMQVA